MASGELTRQLLGHCSTVAKVFQGVSRVLLGGCYGVSGSHKGMHSQLPGCSGWSLEEFLVVVRMFWVQTNKKNILGLYKPLKLQFDCWALLGKTSWATTERVKNRKTDRCLFLTPFVVVFPVIFVFLFKVYKFHSLQKGITKKDVCVCVHVHVSVPVRL